MKVNQDLLKQATPDIAHIVVSIPKQRAYLMIREEIVADAPVSSGKRGHETPRGQFTVMRRIPINIPSPTGASEKDRVRWCVPVSVPPMNRQRTGTHLPARP